MSMMEDLENRNLLTVGVTAVTADNRGEVSITLSGDVKGVQKSTVRPYLPGADGIPNTNDDVRVAKYSVGYNSSTHKITLRASIPANEQIRVRVQSSSIFSKADNSRLDGEFSGSFTTGDGVSGGNFNFRVRRDASQTPRVRFATSAGNIDVTLRGDLSGISTTVNNFIRYANAGVLDGTIIHRKITDADGGIAIVQGGGFYSTAVDSADSPTDVVPAFAPIALQSGVLSNTSGTIAMARTTDPNSATSQFFFNANDNTELDSTGTGTGYAVFGQVSNSSSMTGVTTIYNAPNVAVDANVFSTVPETNGQVFVVRRVALLSRVDTVAANPA